MKFIESIANFLWKRGDGPEPWEFCHSVQDGEPGGTGGALHGNEDLDGYGRRSAVPVRMLHTGGFDESVLNVYGFRHDSSGRRIMAIASHPWDGADFVEVPAERLRPMETEAYLMLEVSDGNPVRLPPVTVLGTVAVPRKGVRWMIWDEVGQKVADVPLGFLKPPRKR